MCVSLTIPIPPFPYKEITMASDLKETYEKAYRDRTEGAVKKAAKDRLKFKKKGGKTRNSLNEDAKKEIKKAEEAKARKAKRDAAKKKAEKKPAKKPVKKTDLSVIGAVKNLLKIKQRNAAAD